MFRTHILVTKLLIYKVQRLIVRESVCLLQINSASLLSIPALPCY